MKQCTRCDKEKKLKLFHKRGISKKTGLPLYNSWCKQCVLEDNKLRRDGDIPKRSPQKALQETAKDRYRGTINPKYLVRGTISINGQSSSAV